MEKKPDILLMMSDQHAASYAGYEKGMVDTPNLDRLAADGIRFAKHYTACPLCVPARMSFLTGRLPVETGVTANNQALAEMSPTFLFPLIEAGYETVLIGRMHFIGKDLRHGFVKRIGGDFTPTTWCPSREEIIKERGVFMQASGSGGCLSVIGGGESPVRYDDEEIVRLTAEYLSYPHEKPQFIIVGTFGPHFPYVADPELYKKYKEKAWLPDTFGKTPDYVEENTWLHRRQKEISLEKAIAANAAYCALVEECDRNVGKIRTIFEKYTEREGHPNIFGYLSDHGDTAGARNMYGKETFFEDAVRVPCLLAGDGLPKGKVILENTSLMDIGPTICELAGTSYRENYVDGVSLTGLWECENPSEKKNERVIVSQYFESKGGPSRWEEKEGVKSQEQTEYCYAVMLKKGKWKYIEYHNQKPLLFNLETDPEEMVNLTGEYPEIAGTMHNIAMKTADPETAETEHRNRCEMSKWLRKYEGVAGAPPEERWKDNPPTARGQLEIQ